MLSYIFDNPRQYNEILQFVSLFLLFVIGAMIYYISKRTDNLKEEVSKLEMECPACPSVPACPENKACPSCPTCPQCPSLTCDEDGKCPDCICPTDKACPVCPPCNANANCPTVKDIVTGIFPGRNPGITENGKYFDVQASENYQLLSDFDFYEAQEAFPSDSILSAPPNLASNNIQVPSNRMNNNMERGNINSNTNTIQTRTLNSNMGNMDTMSTQSSDTDFPRMSRGISGVPGNGNSSPSPTTPAVRSLSP